MTRFARSLAAAAAVASLSLAAPLARACEEDGAHAAKAEAPAGAQTVTYTVSGMSCTGCSSKVEAAIRKLPGIFTVSVDVDKKVATVAFDPAKVKPEQIKKAIAKAGYKPSAVA